MRVIQPHVRSSQASLNHLVQTITACELLYPTTRLYLHVRELHDTILLTSAAGEFSTLLPEMRLENLSLSTFLRVLAGYGTAIYIRHQSKISPQLRQKLDHQQIWCEQQASIYPAGVFSERYILHGPLRFLRNQIAFCDQEILFSTEPAEVKTRQLTAADTWGHPDVHDSI